PRQCLEPPSRTAPPDPTPASEPPTPPPPKPPPPPLPPPPLHPPRPLPNPPNQNGSHKIRPRVTRSRKITSAISHPTGTGRLSEPPLSGTGAAVPGIVTPNSPANA